ncbi:unnamed protein product [Sphenostylis stenocarpa]|uniref:Uncharacterized protein n=1 Tax=Sphenostylis stenocarpa TaxID=92480 RepID=A0AA86SFZ2_9FABA|nr:unnamed protein product [Sphenostylis stenocarpa]
MVRVWTTVGSDEGGGGERLAMGTSPWRWGTGNAIVMVKARLRGEKELEDHWPRDWTKGELWWLRQGVVLYERNAGLSSRRLGEGVRNTEMASCGVREKGMGLSKGIWKGDLVLSEGEKNHEGRRVKLTMEEWVSLSAAKRASEVKGGIVGEREVENYFFKQKIC